MIELELEDGARICADYSLRVGRAPSWADLVLDTDETSRHHLEIRAKGVGYTIWDLGSRNGTMVNGRVVGGSGRALQSGDAIQVGHGAHLRVVSITPPPDALAPTAAGPGSTSLHVELQDDHFVVEFVVEGRRIRDAMPFQLGLALSVLLYHRREGFGPVQDVDLRAIVWRGDAEQVEKGDINRLLLRLRQWFRDRQMEPPPIHRAKGLGTTQIEMPAACLALAPEGWLERYFD